MAERRYDNGNVDSVEFLSLDPVKLYTQEGIRAHRQARCEHGLYMPVARVGSTCITESRVSRALEFDPTIVCNDPHWLGIHFYHVYMDRFLKAIYTIYLWDSVSRLVRIALHVFM